jgi:hypothetical protein
MAGITRERGAVIMGYSAKDQFGQKNVCLLGGCFHFLHHRLGKYSLVRYLGNKR